MRTHDFVEFETFKTDLEARKFLGRMEDQGKLFSTILKHPVRLEGDKTTGRPPKLWTHNWRCSKPRHDDLLKRIILHVMPDRFTCRQVDPDILCDSEWWFGDEHYCIELDMGTMPLATIERTRLPKYQPKMPLTVWIIHEDTDYLVERNLNAMLERRWGPKHLFTTSKKILADPHGTILEYTDEDGDRCETSLPET